MSAAVKMHEAKTHLSRLVDRAAAGETIVISKGNKPMAKLIAVDPPETPEARAARRIGFMKGQFTVPDDFATMMEDEIIAMFEGED